MNDALIGRTLILILTIILGIWLVRDMSWEKDQHRLFFRVSFVLVIVRGFGYLLLDLLGLFPLK